MSTSIKSNSTVISSSHIKAATVTHFRIKHFIVKIPNLLKLISDPLSYLEENERESHVLVFKLFHQQI